MAGAMTFSTPMQGPWLERECYGTKREMGKSVALGPGSLQNGRAGWLVNRTVCLIHLGRLSVCNVYVRCSDQHAYCCMLSRIVFSISTICLAVLKPSRFMSGDVSYSTRYYVPTYLTLPHAAQGRCYYYRSPLHHFLARDVM